MFCIDPAKISAYLNISKVWLLKQFAKQVTRDSETVDKDLVKNGNASS